MNNFNYHSKQDLAVIFTAKAGCTIVNKMFFEQEGLLEEALKLSHWIHHYRSKYINNPEIEKIRHESISSETRWIQFTVNPYRRAVSSYIHCCKHFKECLGVNEYNKSFRHFLKDIFNKKFKNTHFKSQVFSLYEEKDIEYIKLENLNEMLPYINKKYNLNYKLKDSFHHAKNKFNLNKNVKEFVGDITWNELKENLPTNYSYFYDEEIKNLVEKIYDLDIRLFNYTWDEFVQSQESN